MTLNFKDDITLEIGIIAKRKRHNWDSKQNKHPRYKSDNRQLQGYNYTFTGKNKIKPNCKF